jgi:hypothetical protein
MHHKASGVRKRSVEIFALCKSVTGKKRQDHAATTIQSAQRGSLGRRVAEDRPQKNLEAPFKDNKAKTKVAKSKGIKSAISRAHAADNTLPRGYYVEGLAVEHDDKIQKNMAVMAERNKKMEAATVLYPSKKKSGKSKRRF